jgi:ZIP family zinc transporter
MSAFFWVVIASLLPAGGNTVGSLLAGSLRTPPWLIGVALHAATGVAIAVVSVNLMPRILEATPPWLLVMTFLCGAAFSVLLAQGLKRWVSAHKGQSGAWMVYIAVTADLLSDGLMVGVWESAATSPVPYQAAPLCGVHVSSEQCGGNRWWRRQSPPAEQQWGGPSPATGPT